MEKRYQVFISSTSKDLQEERQAVLKAVLELDHMPAGMELFPASDETAWQLIKDVIDASDYYVLIIAGRYGSLDEAGIGYTEKEYDYAISTNKPVVSLLHKQPNSLPREKTDTNKVVWKKLNTFREKVEKKHTCDYWTSAEDLKAKLIVGLTTMIKKKPAIGWVRANLVPKDATINELLKLKTRLQELEKEASESNAKPPVGSEDLLQNDDLFQISLTFSEYDSHSSNFVLKEYSSSMQLSWNQIFAGLAPCLINESSNEELIKRFAGFLGDVAKKKFENETNIKGTSLRDFNFSPIDFDTCIIQLRALGLIKESFKTRSIRDNSTYWTLTPLGDAKMVQLKALRKTPLKDNVTNTVEKKGNSSD